MTIDPETGVLAGRVAVVTGASSGIGRAIAFALSRQKVELCLIGRDPGNLAETVKSTRQFVETVSFKSDLTNGEDLKPLLQHLKQRTGRLDILVHCAGVIHQAPMASANIEDFDIQYATNVRGPYLLTKHLLPWLTASRGDVVFANSSVGLTASRPEVGQYSATKHALKAVADSLRHEVNPTGVRVLSMYLGRTATRMQEQLFQQEGRNYNSEVLLQPDDIASTVVQILMLPRTAEVTDISIRPMLKS